MPGLPQMFRAGDDALTRVARQRPPSERLAPEIRLGRHRLSLQESAEVLPGARHHVVIFSIPTHASHEFYPLMVDAYVRDSARYGRPCTNVVAAHVDWFDADGGVRRIIYLDAERNHLYEVDLGNALRPDTAQFLCLGPREGERHRLLSQALDVVQVNPYSISAMADDKDSTLALWSVANVVIPVFRSFSPGAPAGVRDFLDTSREIVIKPNGGTEGDRVAYFSRSGQWPDESLLAHVERCWESGDVMLQHRCDGVLYRDPDLGSLHTLALRLNLAFNGESFQLESGYVQLGIGPEQPASCGHGGRIESLYVVLTHLVSRRDSRSLSVSRDFWHCLRNQAIRAAAAFHGLLLLGLDVVLDHDPQGELVPVFLEANARPAGLSHSRLWCDAPGASDRAGVSLALWDGIELLCAGATPGWLPREAANHRSAL